MSRTMTKLKGWVLAAAVGLGMAAGAGAATAAGVTPADPAAPVTAGEQSAVYVAGPYYTYSRALDVADSLELLGYYTDVVYRNGYWWVLYT